MEVSDIEAIPLTHTLPDGKGVGSSRGVHTDRATTLVRIETDTGLVGWGEAFAPARPVATLIEDQFSDRVLGMDPFDVESLVRESYTHGYHFARGPFVRCAVSGIDLALWDIIGKSVGRPIHRLIGGTQTDALEPYASSGYVTEWGQDIAEPMARAAEEGFSAAKIKIGRGIEDDVERVETAREELGDDAALMVDYNGNYRPSQVRRSYEAIEGFDITWIEEPVPAENTAGYRELSDDLDVPIAAGEAHFSRFEFKELIDDRLVDIVQPNLGRCGGFSEARLIAEMATTENVAVRPHVWNSAVGVAAALQFAASVPDYPHADTVPVPLRFEFDRSENPLRDDLLMEPLDPTGGEIAVPQEPGLGVEVEEGAVERFRLN